MSEVNITQKHNIVFYLRSNPDFYDIYDYLEDNRRLDWMCRIGQLKILHDFKFTDFLLCTEEHENVDGLAAEVPVGAVQAEMNPMLRFVHLLQDPASQMNSRETNLAKETLQARIIGVRFDSWLQIF